ncbi:hypothetical protein LPIBR_20176 [Lacticaseibacillus paracasei]|nr:hypothetical protein LPIBR_20176 [Lacticaseibacillus paracasei]
MSPTGSRAFTSLTCVLPRKMIIYSSMFSAYAWEAKTSGHHNHITDLRRYVSWLKK